MSTNESLHARHKTVMPSWVGLYYDQPIAIVRGEGRRVWDADGKEYLDFFGGILTTISGHAVPEVVEAIRHQAGKVLHSSTAYLIEPAIELAERIAKLAPVDDPKVFFVPSGTEAIEAALLTACSYRRSNQVLAMRNSYHGRSFAAVGITGNRGWSPTSFTGLSVNYLHGAYRYRSPFRDLPDRDYIETCTQDLRELIATTTSGDVACLIAEPIQGVGGFAYPPDGLYGAFKEVLDEHGILFVSDEVQTGWGRTGEHFWGIEAHDVRPDILVFAKGVANGLALAGIVARGEVMDSVPANSISTFGGTHLNAAGALANLEYMLDHDLQANAAKVGEHLMRGLRELCEKATRIGDVRGKGLMIGLELVRPGTMEPDPSAAGDLLQALGERGLLVGKGGLHGNVIRIAPPLTVTIEEADEALAVFADAVTTN